VLPQQPGRRAGRRGRQAAGRQPLRLPAARAVSAARQQHSRPVSRGSTISSWHASDADGIAYWDVTSCSPAGHLHKWTPTLSQCQRAAGPAWQPAWLAGSGSESGRAAAAVKPHSSASPAGRQRMMTPGSCLLENYSSAGLVRSGNFSSRARGARTRVIIVPGLSIT
jgi:hypothetical protein